jgi:hypothetical protein
MKTADFLKALYIFFAAALSIGFGLAAPAVAQDRSYSLISAARSN